MKNMSFSLVLFFIVILSSYGQTHDRKTDSLLKLLAKSKTEDTTKVKLMVEYMRTLFPANLDSAYRYNERIISLSRKLDFTRGLIRGLNGKALCQWYGKDPRQAIPTFLGSKKRL